MRRIEWRPRLTLRLRARRKNSRRSEQWANRLCSLPPHVAWPLCVASCVASCVVLAIVVRLCRTVEQLCSVLLKAQLAATVSGRYPALLGNVLYTVLSRAAAWC